MSRQLLISNESTVVSDADFAAYVAAQQAQADKDFAPLWGGLRADLVAWPKAKGAPPAGQEIVHVLDNSDQADALGYHELNPHGYPEGFVFAKTTQDDGSAWQTTASHEVLEQLADPLASITSQAGQGKQTVWVSFENCDPVEADSYPIDGVPMSNFVLPLWFTGAPGKMDFLGKLAQGLAMTPGGYIAYADSRGNWHQIFADRATRHKGPTKFSRHARYLLHAQRAGMHRLMAAHAAVNLGNWLQILQGILQVAPGVIASVQQIIQQVGAVLPPPTVTTPGAPVLTGPQTP